jgi:hypothetical protein
LPYIAQLAILATEPRAFQAAPSLRSGFGLLALMAGPEVTDLYAVFDELAADGKMRKIRRQRGCANSIAQADRTFN